MKMNKRITRALAALFIMLLTFSSCAPAFAKIGETYVSRVGGLRVHKSASGSSEVVGKLKKGERVIHRGTAKSWWKIETASGGTGFVYRSYLKAVEPTWKKGAYYEIAKTSRAVVRQGPRSQATKIGTIKKGTTVQLVAKQGNWGRIKLSNGNKGWVMLKFLSYQKG